MARKLLVQYSHASASRLCTLLRSQGVKEGAVMDAVRRAEAECEVSRKHGGRPNHAVVTMPAEGAFNDAVAVDLFFLAGNVAVLHIIDKFSRYSMCMALKDKTAITVSNAFLQWVVKFGAPINALGDAGGEFDNDILRLV